jgi:hypothetical protein
MSERQQEHFKWLAAVTGLIETFGDMTSRLKALEDRENANKILINAWLNKIEHRLDLLEVKVEPP